MTKTYKGIDVSVVQGSNINWQAVANQGIQFCISKCGNGNDGTDYNYKKNIAGSLSVGLYVATYQFVFPLPDAAGHTGRDPISQAQMHFNATNNDHPVIMDFEYPAPQDWSKWGCSASQINDWGLAYLQEYEKLSGKKPLVYVYPFFCNAVKPSQEYANYDLWIASYQTNTPTIPSPWNDWKIWQNSGGGGVMPSGAPVDTNVVRDLSLWGVVASSNQSSSPPTSSISLIPAPAFDPTVPNPEPNLPSPPQANGATLAPTTVQGSTNTITTLLNLFNTIINFIKSLLSKTVK